MTEHRCGSVHNQPVPAIADRAARIVLGYSSPRAVTITPEGIVHVEPVATAAEADLVGVYCRALGILELTRRITEDLRHEVATRALRPVVRRRRVTGAALARNQQARGSA